MDREIIVCRVYTDANVECDSCCITDRTFCRGSNNEWIGNIETNAIRKDRAEISERIDYGNE